MHRMYTAPVCGLWSSGIRNEIAFIKQLAGIMKKTDILLSMCVLEIFDFN